MRRFWPAVCRTGRARWRRGRGESRPRPPSNPSNGRSKPSQMPTTSNGSSPRAVWQSMRVHMTGSSAGDFRSTSAPATSPVPSAGRGRMYSTPKARRAHLPSSATTTADWESTTTGKLSRTAGRESARASTCWRWSTPDSRLRACMWRAGPVGRPTPTVRPQPVSETDLDVLYDLRRRRKRHRLGDIEWFDAAYRVYLVALFGGGTVLWISSSIADETVGADTVANVAKNGPALIGIITALAFMAALRSGAQGGPLALEAADVTYVMLSPVDRVRALLRPVSQRARSAASLAAVSGAIVGQLAGRRLPGTPVAWAASGAAFGITTALLWAGTALVAHTIRLPLWIATTLGLTGVIWQCAALAFHIFGPANFAGSLAMWGWRQHPVDLIAPLVAVIVLLAGIGLLQHTSLDALARRSSLVAQLRFAVTMQDLRTVILLRRQLNQEHTRGRPWLRVPTWITHPIPRRGVASVARFPVTRLVRMTAFAAMAGVFQALVIRGTTPALIGTAFMLFLLGLEAMEPLSQEVDQPDRTDSLPIERGELLVRHLAAPAVALVPFAAVAAAAAIVTLATTRAITPTAILALPTVLAGAAGGVVSIVRDAPDPTKGGAQQAFVPPEMAGVSSALRIGLPIFVSALAAATVLLVRQAERVGTSATGAAIRGAVGAALVAGAVALWVRRRDEWKRKFRLFMSDGQSYTKQRSTL